MSKRNHSEAQTSSRITLIVMAIGGILVLGLVGWALSRSMAPKPAAMQTDATSSATTESATSSATPASAIAEDPGHRPEDEAAKAATPRVTPDQLKQMVDAGNVTIIDVRDSDSYNAAHIAGSLQIPLSRIEGEISYLPKGKPIVAYCT